MPTTKSSWKHPIGILYWSILYILLQYAKTRDFDLFLGFVNGAILYLLMLALQFIQTWMGKEKAPDRNYF